MKQLTDGWIDATSWRSCCAGRDGTAGWTGREAFIVGLPMGFAYTQKD